MVIEMTIWPSCLYYELTCSSKVLLVFIPFTADQPKKDWVLAVTGKLERSSCKWEPPYKTGGYNGCVLTSTPARGCGSWPPELGVIRQKTQTMNLLCQTSNGQALAKLRGGPVKCALRPGHTVAREVGGPGGVLAVLLLNRIIWHIQ